MAIVSCGRIYTPAAEFQPHAQFVNVFCSRSLPRGTAVSDQRLPGRLTAMPRRSLAGGFRPACDVLPGRSRRPLVLNGLLHFTQMYEGEAGPGVLHRSRL